MKRVIDEIYNIPRWKTYSARKHQQVEYDELRAFAFLNTMGANEGHLGLPQTAVGQIKISEEWLPNIKKGWRKLFLEQKFPQDGLGYDDGQWEGAWQVGRVGHSHTGTWFRVDKNDNTKDRLLRKDVYRPAECWADMTL